MLVKLFSIYNLSIYSRGSAARGERATILARAINRYIIRGAKAFGRFIYSRASKYKRERTRGLDEIGLVIKEKARRPISPAAQSYERSIGIYLYSAQRI